MAERKYPVFRDPEQYRRTRRPKRVWEQWVKSVSEFRSIDRCLEGLSGIETVCDIPTGPGRLFHYWRRRGFKVRGYDYSEEMVGAAREALEQEDLPGSVEQADAFALGTEAPESADLVASVRFIYYFDVAGRIELLKSLAKASRRYVLVQYKTTETLKGHINEARNAARTRRPRPEHLAKVGCSHAQILRELTAAGLVPLRIEPIGELSDRAYVLAEKVGAEVGGALDDTPPRISISNTSPTNLHTVVFLVLALVYLAGYGARGVWEQDEAYLALGAHQVLEGNVLLPTIYGDHLAVSPPVAFWWYSLGGWIFHGVSETSLFLMSLMAAMLTLAATFRLGCRWGGREVGLLSLVILGTSYGFWEMACRANEEMLTALLFVVVLDGATSAPDSRNGTRFPWASWAALALLPLCGGVTWLAVAMASLVLASGWNHGKAMATAILPTLLWAALASATYGFPAALGVLLRMGHGRLADILGDANPWYFYLHEMPLNLLPWSLLLVPLLWMAARARTLRPPLAWQRFGLAMLTIGLALLSTRAVKENHHLLPLAPLAALLLAGFIWHQALNAAQAAAHRPAEAGRRFWGRFLGLRRGLFYPAVALVAVVSIAGYSIVVLRMHEPWESADALKALVYRYVQLDEPLVVFEDEDLRLLFHLPERTQVVQGNRVDLDKLTRLAAAPGELNALVNEEDLEKFLRRANVEFHVAGTTTFRGERYLLLATGLEPTEDE